MAIPIIAAPARLPLILAGMSLLGMLYQNLSHNDRDISARVSRLEAHQEDSTERLDRIELKLDRFMEYMGVRLQGKK